MSRVQISSESKWSWVIYKLNKRLIGFQFYILFFCLYFRKNWSWSDTTQWWTSAKWKCRWCRRGIIFFFILAFLLVKCALCLILCYPRIITIWKMKPICIVNHRKIPLFLEFEVSFWHYNSKQCKVTLWNPVPLVLTYYSVQLHHSQIHNGQWSGIKGIVIQQYLQLGDWKSVLYVQI